MLYKLLVRLISFIAMTHCIRSSSTIAVKAFFMLSYALSLNVLHDAQVNSGVPRAVEVADKNCGKNPDGTWRATIRISKIIINHA
jgi:hypothetical protein